MSWNVMQQFDSGFWSKIKEGTGSEMTGIASTSKPALQNEVLMDQYLGDD